MKTHELQCPYGQAILHRRPSPPGAVCICPEEGLIPPDPKRCQGEKREGSFMSMGPRSLIRCTRKPVVLARDPKPPHNEMSLCGPCRDICEKQIPGVTFRWIDS